ncbi:MAG: PAS domain S-box protein [Candidatus Abyssobacteria bacterium SURF_5]|uniref:histidine kinase n=1 Tax=Abyssobacteria bacterium (strain SURF_5) TaxID=2093360 RepID=A0A3A4NEA0_ABYX5|nr:MAG: PAS domain S-box protein [Candidatus Abyssubacteria bacterium SURF_5]
MNDFAYLQRILTEQKVTLLNPSIADPAKRALVRNFLESVFSHLMLCLGGAEIGACASKAAEAALQEARTKTELLASLDDFELAALNVMQSSFKDEALPPTWGSVFRFFCETRKRLRSRSPAEPLEPARNDFPGLFDEVIHQILNPSIGPEEVLKLICDGALKLTAAEAVAIYAIDRENNSFLLKQFAAGPLFRQIEQKKLPEFLAAFASIPRKPEDAEGLFHIALTQRKPVFSSDIMKDGRVHMPEALKQLGVDAMLVIPMLEPENEVGFISAVPPPNSSFSDAEIENLSVFADLAAVTWRNAQLYNDLRKSERRYRYLIDNAIDIIFILDMQGRFVSINKRGEQLTGHKAEGWIGRHFSELISADDLSEVLQGWSRGTAGGANVMPVRIQTARGEDLYLKVNSSLLEEDGEIKGQMCIARDATEETKREAEFKRLHESVVEANHKLEESMAKLKSAQAKLVQTEKLSAMGELISGIAHELNNPLTGIMGYTQLLLETAENDKYRQDLEKINTAAYRCKQIIQNLLRFSRSHKPQKQRIDIQAVIKSVAELKRYQLQLDGIKLNLQLQENGLYIIGDHYQLQQVILNLINNAHQAIHTAKSGGAIDVRTVCDEASGRARVFVSDDGPGIPQEVLPRIFDPFFTTKEPGAGTGLGLSVVYGIIQEHGGQITTESVPHKHTTFSLELPLDGSSTSDKGADEKIKPSSKSSSVLVVDDEEVILDLLTDIFSQMDYSVERAHNGAEALEKVRKKPFDIIICDLKMPGMDGKTFFQKVTKSNPGLAQKIIFSTGDTLSEDFRAFCAETRRIVVEKPFFLDDLKNAIEAVEENQFRPPE